jgi:hypothetical protein
LTTVVHSVNIMVFTLVVAVSFVIYAILTYDDKNSH